MVTHSRCYPVLVDLSHSDFEGPGVHRCTDIHAVETLMHIKQILK